LNLIKAAIFDLGNTLVSEDTGDAFPFAIEVLTQLKNKYKLALITNARARLSGGAFWAAAGPPSPGARACVCF